MKLTLLLSLSVSTLSYASVMDVFIIPPASKLELKNTRSLLRSFKASHGLAKLNNRGMDKWRRTLGHAFVILNCDSSQRWTSVSVNLKGFPGYMQSERELSSFLDQNLHEAVHHRYEISSEICEQLIRVDDHYRKQEHVVFSATGLNGASYSLQLLKLANIEVDAKACLERFLGRSFYSAQGLKNCLAQ